VFIGRTISEIRQIVGQFHRVGIGLPANEHGIGYLGWFFYRTDLIISQAGKRKLTDIGLYLSQILEILFLDGL